MKEQYSEFLESEVALKKCQVEEPMKTEVGRWILSETKLQT
jgi:hypothetical protein